MVSHSRLTYSSLDSVSILRAGEGVDRCNYVWRCLRAASRRSRIAGRQSATHHREGVPVLAVYCSGRGAGAVPPLHRRPLAPVRPCTTCRSCTARAAPATHLHRPRPCAVPTPRSSRAPPATTCTVPPLNDPAVMKVYCPPSGTLPHRHLPHGQLRIRQIYGKT